MLQNLYLLTSLPSSGVHGQAAALFWPQCEKTWWLDGVQMPQSKLETPCHLLYILKQTKRTRNKTTKEKKNQKQICEKQSFLQTSGQVLNSSTFHSHTVFLFFYLEYLSFFTNLFIALWHFIQNEMDIFCQCPIKFLPRIRQGLEIRTDILLQWICST